MLGTFALAMGMTFAPPTAAAAPPAEQELPQNAPAPTVEAPTVEAPTVQAPMDIGPAAQPPGGKDEGGVGSLSAGGTETGGLELGLGAASLAIGVGLLVAGSVDLKRGLDRKAQCELSSESVCSLDAPGLIFASSGLAFAFSVPAIVGGSLLIRRGARIHRDYKRVRALAGRTRAGFWIRRGAQRGGGVSLRMQF